VSSDLWLRYLEATAGRAPRPLLLRALDRLPGFSGRGGRALELGAGAGSDTLALLQAGWEVLVVDATLPTLETARELAREAGLEDRLDTRHLRFEELELVPAAFDLVHAEFALPFCDPAHFDRLWASLRAALRPGGIFAGQLFGDRDTWARAPLEGVEGPMTFLARERVEQLIEGYEVLEFEEEEGERKTALGDLKDWHLFHLLLRRPSDGTTRVRMSPGHQGGAPGEPHAHPER